MDLADKATEYTQAEIDNRKAEILIQGNNFEKGKPGECDFCGEHFSRLVDGACGACRDKYKL